MRRVLSVATLAQEKILIISRIPEYAKEIGIKKTIDYIILFLIPQIIKKESEEIVIELIKQFTPLAKVIIDNREGYSAVSKELVRHY